MTTEPIFSEDELERMINKILIKLDKEYLNLYVEKGKLNKEEKIVIQKSVEDILRFQFIPQFDDSISYCNILMKYYPKLDKTKYREKYRSVLEYLAKIAKSSMIEKLKKEF